MTAGYSYADLVAWLADVFTASGLDAAAAQQAATTLVRTEARGISTHGLIRSQIYAHRLLNGEVNRAARPWIERREGVLHFHADGGLGQVAGVRAVDAAVERAEETGVVVMLIHEIGHLAALGTFALRAAEAGMLCLLMQSTPPVMALPGARRAAIGNNPIAFASPVPDGPPLVVDVALSRVARGNLLLAAAAGRQIPDGWAQDSGGQPTNLPEAALEGTLLPAADHKGIGLAMMVECLAGSLVGTVRQSGAGRATLAPSRVGAFLLLLNPDLVTGRDAYLDQVREWLAEYKDASGADGRYPGERAALLEAERQANGIPLTNELVASLTKLGKTMGVAFPIQE